MEQRLFFGAADFIIPRDADMQKWSVVACDQFSSEPEYWEKVKNFVGRSPSTLHMILPEAYLNEADVGERIDKIKQNMSAFLVGGEYEILPDTMIYIERELSGGGVRRGLIGAVDLESYDYRPEAAAMIRASEGTILERIPPRLKIRSGAGLEFSHVMALIDDREKSVIEKIDKSAARAVYDFDLMEGGGRIRGWALGKGEIERIKDALSVLASDDLGSIIGDGNHSLVTAKAMWDDIKGSLTDAKREGHPARFSTVELNNIYDDAIGFEAIHRVVTGTDVDKMLGEAEKNFGALGTEIRYVAGDRRGTVSVPASDTAGIIDALQNFLEAFVSENGGEIDYIHGDGALEKLAGRRDAIGFLLPAMEKSDFFGAIKRRGVLPKKSFSIGHASDKRYYLEGRKIVK